jgi:hypothetical protein
MCSSNNTPDLQQVQTTMTPILIRHRSSMYIPCQVYLKRLIMFTIKYFSTIIFLLIVAVVLLLVLVVVITVTTPTTIPTGRRKIDYDNKAWRTKSLFPRDCSVRLYDVCSLHVCRNCIQILIYFYSTRIL